MPQADMKRIAARSTSIMPRPSVHESGSESDSASSLGDIFHMLWVHRWFILICALTGLVCSILYVVVKTPVYQASATIRIDPSRAGSLGLGDAAAGQPADTSDIIHTEIGIIKGDAVAIKALNSLSDEEYFAYSGVLRDGLIPEEVGALSASQQRLIDGLELATEVKQVEGTQLVDVTLRDRNPQMAATMVNHLIQAYEVQNFASRDESVAQVRKWFLSQMATLKQQVDTAQKKLADFQEANGIVGTDGANNTITDRLRFLNDKLAAAQADRITKEAQLRAAKVGDPGALAALFPNPKLDSLQREQGTLYAQYAQLAAKFGPKYGPLVDLQKQMKAVDGEIKADVQSVQNQLYQQYDAANTAQKMLQGEYYQQTKLAYSLNRNQAEYAALQSEVTSSTELYNSLRRKLQEAGINAQVSGVNTMSIETARVPSKPIEPKKALVIASGTIIGLFAGIASAFFFDTTSGKARRIAQIEREVGYQVLATIPSGQLALATSNGFAAESLEISPRKSLITLQQPDSSGAEAYRSLRDAISLSARRRPIKTLLVTSAVPEEDVEIAMANYAIAVAQSGSRVLVVDADLRCPSIHLCFGVENEPGLNDHLMGGTVPVAHSQPLTDVKNLSLLTAGKKGALPSESLASERFFSALLQWESDFDLVLVKAAPLLIDSTSLLLANRMDAVLLVACYNNAHPQELAQVHGLLSRANARVVGTVINNVPSAGEYLESQERLGLPRYA